MRSRSESAALVVALLAAAAGSTAEFRAAPRTEARETILARHDDYAFPEWLRLREGRHLPDGTFDLTVLLSDGKVLLQLAPRGGGPGLRVPAEAVGRVAGPGHAAAAPVTVTLRSGPDGDILQVQGEGLAAVFPLGAVRSLGS